MLYCATTSAPSPSTYALAPHALFLITAEPLTLITVTYPYSDACIDARRRRRRPALAVSYIDSVVIQPLGGLEDDEQYHS